MKDTSLRVPPGIEGIVIDAKVFTRKGGEKDERAQDPGRPGSRAPVPDQEDEIRIIFDAVLSKIRAQLLGKTSAGPANLGGQGRSAPREAEEDHGRGAGRNPERALGEIGVEEDPG